MTYDTLATQEVIDKTAAALTNNNIEAVIVENGAAALEKIKQLIPKGASVMNGSSTTLHEIGFIDYLKSDKHGWDNLHETILAEKDPEKQAMLRKQSVFSDYYLGSVHALAQSGEFVIVSNSGSQLPHIVYTSQNLIFVVGTQKIVLTLDAARKRVSEYVTPLEDKRMKGLGKAGTHLSKELIFHWENPNMGRKVRMILVKEKLGF